MENFQFRGIFHPRVKRFGKIARKFLTKSVFQNCLTYTFCYLPKNNVKLFRHKQKHFYLDY